MPLEHRQVQGGTPSERLVCVGCPIEKNIDTILDFCVTSLRRGHANLLIYTPRIHWVTRGTGAPKDRDEFNKREVCKCDGWGCDLDARGAPSIFRIIRSDAVWVRIFQHLDFSYEENSALRKWNCPQSCCASWTPEAAKKRSVSRWACKNGRRTRSICSLPDVLVVAGIKEIAFGGLLL